LLRFLHPNFNVSSRIRELRHATGLGEYLYDTIVQYEIGDSFT
jgi:hypothetical protein